MKISNNDNTLDPVKRESHPPISVMNLFAGYAGTSLISVKVLERYLKESIGNMSFTSNVVSICNSWQLTGQSHPKARSLR